MWEVLKNPYIKTSDDKISIYRPSEDPTTINWHQITECKLPLPHVGRIITFKYLDRVDDKEYSKTIDLEIDLLQENQRNEFLQLLNTRLDFLKKSETISCYECGNPIMPEDDSCSKCGWNWK